MILADLLETPLDRGAGQDTLQGFTGSDILAGGADNDLYVFSHQTTFGEIDLISEAVDGGSGNDELHGSGERDRIFGGDGQDLIFGVDGIDQLYGGAGDDTLRGGAGNDFLFGDSGNDTLTGEEGRDTFYGGDGVDTVNSDAGESLTSAERVNITMDTLEEQIDNWSCGPYSRARFLRSYGHDASYLQLRSMASSDSLLTQMGLGTSTRELRDLLRNWRPATASHEETDFGRIVSNLLAGIPVLALVNVGSAIRLSRAESACW